MKVKPVVECFDKVVRDIQSDLVIVGSGERHRRRQSPRRRHQGQARDRESPQPRCIDFIT